MRRLGFVAILLVLLVSALSHRLAAAPPGAPVIATQIVSSTTLRGTVLDATSRNSAVAVGIDIADHAEGLDASQHAAGTSERSASEFVGTLVVCPEVV